MDAFRLNAYARRRLADDPEACPIEAGDAALMLAWLAALETEAELDREAVDAALAADRDERRAEMAASFRRGTGIGIGGNRGGGNDGRAALPAVTEAIVIEG
jgi:hypothetical protein